jgi:large subunit ribosomal protein L21
LIVFRYKAKKRFRHRRGHRQELTVLTIDDIVADGKSLVTGKPPVAREEPVEEEEATPVTTEADANETPVSEAAETETEQRTTRRRRTAKVEDTESKAEE